jgi:Domain of unknown function (DUF4468) with TBP-like fold
MKLKIAIIFLIISNMLGCVSVPPELMPITTEQREFTYDYSAPKKSQKELFNSARNYFALSYGDSKEVTKVEDELQGTIIGKAKVKWLYALNSLVVNQQIPYYSDYNIIFIAKDGKARLQLNFVESVSVPPKRDYPQIVQQFKSIADGLGKALDGQSEIDKLKNF